MTDPVPLVYYQEAVETYRKGDKEKALSLLAAAIGIAEPTPEMKIAVDNLLTPGKPANEAILGLVAAQTAKRSSR